jgi:hypothetical protein
VLFRSLLKSILVGNNYIFTSRHDPLHSCAFSLVLPHSLPWQPLVTIHSDEFCCLLLTATLFSISTHEVLFPHFYEPPTLDLPEFQQHELGPSYSSLTLLHRTCIFWLAASLLACPEANQIFRSSQDTRPHFEGPEKLGLRPKFHQNKKWYCHYLLTHNLVIKNICHCPSQPSASVWRSSPKDHKRLETWLDWWDQSMLVQWPVVIT